MGTACEDARQEARIQAALQRKRSDALARRLLVVPSGDEISGRGGYRSRRKSRRRSPGFRASEDRRVWRQQAPPDIEGGPDADDRKRGEAHAGARRARASADACRRVRDSQLPVVPSPLVGGEATGGWCCQAWMTLRTG